MMRYPNLRHLRAFQAIVCYGSINRAAQEVHISQPALTQAIQKLERQFDALLFERRSTGMFLTSAGEIVLARTERTFARLAAASRRSAQGSRRAGVLEVPKIERLATAAQLRAYVAVIKEGGYAAAARALGHAQPTVYRAAREFEKLARAPLFERVSQGVLPTKLGRKLAIFASLALKEIESITPDLEEHRGVVQGHLNIAALPLMRSYILPKALIRISALHPSASYNLIVGSYDVLVNHLRHGDADFLFGALRTPPIDEDLLQETLFMDSVCVMARVGHPLAGIQEVTCKELKQYPWVVPREGTPTRRVFSELFDGQEPPADQRIETSSLVVVRSLLLQSDRLTIISRRQVFYEEQAGMLTALPVVLRGAERPIGVTTRNDWKPTQLQRDFVDAVRAAVNEDTDRPVQV